MTVADNVSTQNGDETFRGEHNLYNVSRVRRSKVNQNAGVCIIELNQILFFQHQTKTLNIAQSR